ncbi:MAG TPA: FHA domain-containing protein [Candidatus Polarisedimenticolia bacterium]|nr:FHA domain-containing protein [Candidatus Polarisedimenticolia bacterium]
MPEARSATGAYLAALTPETSDAIQAREINIPFLPFRVGRESRRARWTDQGLVTERRKSVPPNNDLYLTDLDEPMNVSREHFLIGRDAAGFFLLDRGSTCGTIVEGDVVGGGAAGGRAVLRDHDVIVVGSSSSRFLFKFRLET